MKTYSIYISGYGAEVTQGSISPENIEKIYQVLESNSSTENTYDIASAVVELDFAEDGFQWFDIDDNFHASGAYLSDSTLYVENENGDVIYSIPCHEIENLKSHETYDAMAPEDTGFGILTCYSIEKGCFGSGTITVEEFDPKLISLQIDALEDIEIITSIRYNDTEIDDYDYGDTMQKDFQAYLD